MLGEEAGGAGGGHVAFKKFAVGAGEVHDDEAVEAVVEFGVHVEGDQLATQLEILPEKDRDGLAVGFEVGDEVAEFVEIARDGFDRIPAGTQGAAGTDEAGQGGVAALLTEDAGHEFARDAGVVRADADRAEENVGGGVFQHKLADAFPEQQQRLEAALVSRGDEAAPQFNGGAEALQKLGAEVEERAGVEPIEAVVGHDFADQAETVGAGDFLFGAVPEKEVVVVSVVTVEVQRAAGAFAGRAEGFFAEAADFAQGMRNGGARGAEDLELGHFEQGSGGKFGQQLCGGSGRGNGEAATGAQGTGPVAFAEQVGAPAEMFHEVSIGGEGGEAVRGDECTAAEVDFALLFIEELVGEQGSAEAGMDEAGQLEEGAVAAFDVEREGGGAGATQEAGNGVVPGGIGDVGAGELELELGDFASGEDEEEAAGLKPGQGFAHAASVGAFGGGAAEGVHGNDAVGDFGEGGDDVIGEDLDVGADLGEKLREGDAFDNAEGVVGDGENRAGAGDAFVVGGREVDGNVEGGEEAFAEGFGGARVELAVEIVGLFHLEDAEEGVEDGLGQGGGQGFGESAAERGGRGGGEREHGCYPRG